MTMQALPYPLLTSNLTVPRFPVDQRHPQMELHLCGSDPLCRCSMRGDDGILQSRTRPDYSGAKDPIRSPI